MSEWNIDPCNPAAWCPKCKGPMLEDGCANGDACKPDTGAWHAFELAMAPSQPSPASRSEEKTK